MMGRSHAVSGFAVGLWAGVHGAGLTVVQAAPLALLCGGWALVPDLDCKGSTASRLLGPLTGALSWVLSRSSGLLYRHTKGPRDEDCAGTHRHLSHTLLFAAVVGLLAGWTSTLSPWVVAGWLLVGLLGAERAMGNWVLLVFAAGLTAPALGALADAGSLADVADAGVHAVNTALASSAPWVGWVAALGCIVHDLGDMLTEAGVPFLTPLPIAGETWFELRPPALLRFHTGKAFEHAVVFPLLVVTAVLAVPPVGAAVAGWAGHVLGFTA